MKPLIILAIIAIIMTLAFAASADVCLDGICAPDSPVSPVSVVSPIYLPVVMR